MKILLAVDGSKHSLDAVKCLIAHANWYRGRPVVELVSVHLPVPKLPRMSYVVGKSQSIAFKARVLVGQVAESLVQHAKKTRCDLIFIGTRGRTAAANLLLGSTATKVLHIAKVPVLLVR